MIAFYKIHQMLLNWIVESYLVNQQLINTHLIWQKKSTRFNIKIETYF
jgi:hypothetical protein